MDGYKLVPETGSVEEVPVVPTPETPTPSPEPKPEETPTPEVPKVDPEPPAPDASKIEPDTYDLPDGRKVDGKTLMKEWKENFLPDYTRKSQELASLKRGEKTEINKPSDDVPDWKKPDFVPETYGDLVEIAKREIIKDMKDGAEKQAAEQKALADAIDADIAEIKKIDPTIDENLVFAHANKYGFKDLKQAHANYRAMKDVEINTEKRVLQNIQSRKETPVADGKTTKVTPPSTEGITYDPVNVNQSASEFLQSLKKK